ncbi:MAG: ECF transporter S component [Bacilli bacterium]|nr:ECF transporter S component [Bacilli bacterium]
MNQKLHERLLWISETAIFLALLVALQYVLGFIGGAPLVGQIITGSIVNLLLILSTMVVGLTSGITIAIISPVMAYVLTGKPPFPVFIPFVAIGNVVLVLITGYFFRKYLEKNQKQDIALKSGVLVLGAFAKFATLYLLIVVLAMNYLVPDIKEAQKNALTLMFSWPQLLTATIGGILALSLTKPISKVVAKIK